MPFSRTNRSLARTPVLLLFLFLAAAGLSACAAPPAPFPAAAAGKEGRIGGAAAGDIADIGALKVEVSRLVERGDLASADALLRRALGGPAFPGREGELRKLLVSLRRKQFLRLCPLRLEVVTDREGYSFDERVDLAFRIVNLSREALEIPSRGSFGWLPFTESRRSFISLNVATTDVPERGTVLTGGRWNEIIPLKGTLVIEPGSFAEIPFGLTPAAAPGLLYRRLEIEAELIPGGLEWKGLDYGMVRLPFHGARVHFLGGKVEGHPRSSPEDLDAAAAGRDYQALFKAAVLLDDDDRPKGVAVLMSLLPSLPSGAERLAMAALSILTGKDFGFDRARWIEWWRGEKARPGDPAGKDAVQGRAQGTLFEPFSLLGVFFGGFPFLGEAFCSEAIRPDSRKPSKEPGGSFPGQGASSRSPLRQSRLDALARDLKAPFYALRYGTIRRIASMGEKALPLLEKLAAVPDPRTRAGAAKALALIGGKNAAGILEKRGTEETDREVRQAVVQGLARLEAPFPSSPPRGTSSREASLLRKLYDDNRLMVAMEEVMHDGTIPGFYDGQFSSFWKIAPDIYQTLARIALDEDYQFIPRVLAIMSLSEKKPPSIEDDLKPLIIPPREELSREWYAFFNLRTSETLTEEMIEENRRLKLSGYARYSLAKAGIDRYVSAKIVEMKRWIDRNRVVIDEKGTFKDIFGIRLRLKREFCRNLYFDIGYEYHQMDAYDRAESWYKKLIARFPDSSAAANAHYNLACVYAIENRTEEALKHLSLCIEMGFVDFSWMEKDRDLESIRGLPAFKVLKRRALEGGGEKEEGREKKGGG